MTIPNKKTHVIRAIEKCNAKNECYESHEEEKKHIFPLNFGFVLLDSMHWPRTDIN